MNNYWFINLWLLDIDLLDLDMYRKVVKGCVFNLICIRK